ncbi:Plant specific Rop nucleotide exchanger, PRONE [Corchorus olitorius]|uniref:Plant specific Rop nucleotide exchanger, PRONE n=1 Tax=Corchorus olitorius TaxID=93759 RepID=A0A1R3GJA1_9ROSI|nr:Plant specific Rop nucleotide exchanger, PRONE [Corchorus olitorius]
MVRTLSRRCSILHSSKSFQARPDNSRRFQPHEVPDVNGDHVENVDDDQSPQSRNDDTRNAEDQTIEQRSSSVGVSTPRTPQTSDTDQMRERFAKLLLGEDMSGGGKGVSSALALSNAVTNLAASVFGEQSKLEPMAPDTKARWRKEMDWLLSVTDHIVEFVPSQQKSKDGTNMEDVLDNFGKQEKEFWYVSKNDDPDNENTQPDKWWHPTVKVPSNGLSEASRRWLQGQKDSVNQVLKAAMAINANVLAEMEVPESYIESLPKNGRASLGDTIYKSITVEYFDPGQFLAAMDLSTDHKVLDLKNRIEASIVIWKRKMNQKDGRSSWGSSVSLEKRELFEERAETILLLLKQHFPGLPQSTLDISKIQYNRDVGQAILESYSRILESLAYTVMSRIEDVLHADSLTQTESSPSTSDMSSSNTDEDTSETPTLSDFMGWEMSFSRSNITDLELCSKLDNDKKAAKPPISPTPKKASYLDKLENLSGLRSPSERD